ncbi:unnamed protein product [Rotaria sordida]|uniref:Uncharacterized protein n=1 Tax=Rotaria sordida TaxID=392033 RepID=A0A814EZ42_9BILA|nr:unnamed protein product [Rotaria sordida]CAF1323149.1 unnamed protein product [Rotaria sordida]CAF3678303.1 unnamed protein product [Rotaria sordida]CAF3731821.1 unnamed protein product [Rotaria sordida]
MSNTTTLSSTSSLVLNEEMDHIITLCSHISQVASRIRLTHLSNISFSSKYIKSYHHELLSMAENVEGSAVLLESLLAVEKRKPISIQTKKSRYHYTREELLKLRQHVTPSLSTQIKNILNDAIERECNQSNKLGTYSSRNIRTILL